MSDSSDNDSSFIGPVIPPQLLKKEEDKPDTSDVYGPALPPSLKSSKDKVVSIGPQLPSSFAHAQRPSYSSDEEVDDGDKVNSDDSDEGIIGPQPYLGDRNVLHVARLKKEFEDRAERMKSKLCGSEEEKPAEREEWMTSPPTQLTKAFGPGPRKFSARNAPVDTNNSLWTSVPGKPSQSKSSEVVTEKVDMVNSSKEQVFSKYVDDFKKNQGEESLMDIHKKNLKRKQDKDPTPQERRPFDRNVDLDAHRLDSAQRDAIVKRSRQLNDRFSAGNSKFL